MIHLYLSNENIKSHDFKTTSHQLIAKNVKPNYIRRYIRLFDTPIKMYLHLKIGLIC
jgi:hypothetical protein